MSFVAKNFIHWGSGMESVFAAHQLDSFSSLWDADIHLVDAPNIGRGGRSEVGVLTLSDSRDRFFVKRQQHYNCRTLAHPLQGIPVAVREWQKIQCLDAVGIKTLDVVFCGRHCGDEERAIFITRALDDYVAMKEWLTMPLPAGERQQGLIALGQLVGRLHGYGFKHGCLYSKHVYFSKNDVTDLRFIDLEKCKKTLLKKAGLRDLETLFRRTPELTAEDRELLLKGYIDTCPVKWTLQALQLAVADKVRAKEVRLNGG